MSFGWSAGDIVAAIRLVNRIITSFGNIGGSREHFQELESELRGLSRALNEISELAGIPGQIPDIVALKFALASAETLWRDFMGGLSPSMRV
jgi:hypothetical protein